MIRLTLVGCKNVSPYERFAGRLRHARIAAAVDPDPEFTRAQLDACDAVVIHAEAESRAELAIRAADARKHVLVEAPLARSVEDADRVIQSCRDARVRLMVGQPKRFLPAAAALKDSLTSGKLGALGLLRMHRWEPRATGVSRPLAEVMTEIDMAHWLFAAVPTAIHASSRELDAGPYLQLHFGFPEGGMALIDHASTLSEGRGYFSLSAIGSSGAAYADDHHNTHLVYRGGDPRALVSGQESACLASQLAEFVNAITEDRDPAITGADGRAALETAAAIASSISSGRAVRRQGGTYELVG